MVEIFKLPDNINIDIQPLTIEIPETMRANFKGIAGLVFSEDGHLGIASLSSRCAFVLDQNGNLVSKYCGRLDMFDASYCCNKFAFTETDLFEDNNYVNIYDLSTGTWRRIELPSSYVKGVTLLQDGFLVGHNRLGYFDFNGNMRWKTKKIEYLQRGPLVLGNYIYVARNDWINDNKGRIEIYNISNGKREKKIKFPEPAWIARSCNDYIAVGMAHHVYLYKINENDPFNLNKVWRYGNIASRCTDFNCFGAIDIDFNPDCRYLISADSEGKRAIIFNVKTGRPVIDIRFDKRVLSVAWWRDRIAVGLDSGIQFFNVVI